eukprot:TRINITY_DN9077_c0_g1_i1.p1 TRINITY_DN9077_c0_g1~~TRINITY_DN9077_c0_g1_i1.p1  ORF type:complete len:877 (+),score=155.75 TRINITY_DN9077_c0_g1_i1:128-2758(+)
MLNLLVVKQAFLKPLTEMQHVGHDMDARIPADIDTINTHKLFGNAEALHRVSLSFLRKLENILVLSPTRMFEDGHCSLSTVASYALDLAQLQACMQSMHAAIMMPELAYRLNQPSAMEYLDLLSATAHGASSPACGQRWTSIAAAFVAWGEEDPLCSRHTLKDLLTQPLQRLMRYPMLLSAVVKEARNCHYQPSQTAELSEWVESLSRSIESHNEHVYQQQTLEELESLEARLRWPSAIDVSMQHGDASCLIPSCLRSHLSARPTVSLVLLWQKMESCLHSLSPDHASPSKTRTMLHTGWFSLVSSSGRLGSDIYIILLGQSLLMCKSGTVISGRRSTTRQRMTSSSDASVRRASRDSLSSQTSDDGKPHTPLLLQDRPYDLAELEIHHNLPEMADTDIFILLRSPLGHPYRCWCLRASSPFECQRWVQRFQEAKATRSPGGSMHELLAEPPQLRPPSSLAKRRNRTSAISFDSRASVSDDGLTIPCSSSATKNTSSSSMSTPGSPVMTATSPVRSNPGLLSPPAYARRRAKLTRDAAVGERSGSPLRLGYVSRSSSRTTGYHSNSEAGSAVSLAYSEGSTRSDHCGWERPPPSRLDTGEGLRVIDTLLGAGGESVTPRVVRPSPRRSIGAKTDLQTPTISPSQSNGGDVTPQPCHYNSNTTPQPSDSDNVNPSEIERHSNNNSVSRLAMPSSSSSEEFDSIFDLTRPRTASTSSNNTSPRSRTASSASKQSRRTSASTRRSSGHSNRSPKPSNGSSDITDTSRSSQGQYELFPTDSQLELELISIGQQEAAKQRVRRVNSMRRATSVCRRDSSSPQPRSRSNSLARKRRSTSVRIRQRAGTADATTVRQLGARPGLNKTTSSSGALLNGLRDTVV